MLLKALVWKCTVFIGDLITVALSTKMSVDLFLQPGVNSMDAQVGKYKQFVTISKYFTKIRWSIKGKKKIILFCKMWFSISVPDIFIESQKKKFFFQTLIN